MTNDRHSLLPSVIVLGTGVFWGFYWIPVRSLIEHGLTGAWGTVAITVSAVFLLLPAALLRLPLILRAGPVALSSVALGGAAFSLYSIGFGYGRVAIIILLYFLTPVWSTLIARYVMGWHTPRMRIVAIAIGLAGLAVMLSANGELPLPRSIGEWLSLVAGISWSVATTGIRARPNIGPFEATFVFACGAAAISLLLAPVLGMPASGHPRTDVDYGYIAMVSIGTGGVWWALSIGGLMWATPRLEPARVGILLMIEVLVGAVSAAVLADEYLTILEITGGALVLLAGILELWPVREETRRSKSGTGD